MTKKFILFCILLPAAVFLTGLPSASGQTSTDDKLAQMFFQDRDFEKAASIYQRLHDQKPSNLYYTYLIYCYLEIQEYDKAEKLVKKQIRLEPGALRYKVDLGYVYFRQNEPEKARKQYSNVLDDLPADRNRVIEVANAFLSRRENDLAIQTYEKGKKLLGGAYPFSLELANMYMVTGNVEEMTEEYLNYLDFDPKVANVVQGRLQDALNNDIDGSRNEIFRKALLRRIQRFPERTYYSEMMIWYSVQQKDFDLALTQARSLDRRLGEDGSRVFELGRLALNNNDYAVAEAAFRYVLDKGPENINYPESRLQLLQTIFLKVTGNFTYTDKDLKNLEQEFQTTLEEMGEGASTLSLIRNYAHLEAFYLNQAPKAIELLNGAIEIPGGNAMQIAECKIELADILLFTGEVWEATLLYSQVDKAFKNDPLGHLAKFKNAKLSYYIGEFAWARAQVDVLKAATSKLISNDAMDLSLLIGDNLNMDTVGTALLMFARADLLEYQNRDAEAVVILDSIPLMITGHSLYDDVLYKLGIISMKAGNFQQADSLFNALVNTYPDEILADNALFRMAELNENQLNNKSKAMDLYQELLTKYPGSLFVVEARKRFRTLRGDPVN